MDYPAPMNRLALLLLVASCPLGGCYVERRRPVYVEPPREERHERREEHRENKHEERHEDHHEDHHD